MKTVVFVIFLDTTKSTDLILTAVGNQTDLSFPCTQNQLFYYLVH